ncbi:MAG: hypothetical protein QOF53_1920 [Nocardioidaceae bacterium]|nr:hypothetical protein [Nocardioidaceae bacterium]
MVMIVSRGVGCRTAGGAERLPVWTGWVGGSGDHWYRRGGDSEGDQQSAAGRPGDGRRWSVGSIVCQRLHSREQGTRHQHTAALAANPRKNERIRRIPSGSRSLAGSCRISTCGSPTIAVAIPTLTHAEAAPLERAVWPRHKSREVERFLSAARGDPGGDAPRPQMVPARPAPMRSRCLEGCTHDPRRFGEVYDGRPPMVAAPALGLPLCLD